MKRTLNFLAAALFVPAIAATTASASDHSSEISVDRIETDRHSDDYGDRRGDDRRDRDNSGAREFVRALYEGFRGGERDGEFRNWVRKLQRGTSCERVATRFFNSYETRDYLGDKRDRGFVRALYRALLGRRGDRGGVDFWTDRLWSRSRSRVFEEFINAPGGDRRRPEFDRRCVRLGLENW